MPLIKDPFYDASLDEDAAPQRHPGYWTDAEGRTHLVSVLDHEEAGRIAHIEYFDEAKPIGEQRTRARVPSTSIRSIFER